MPSKTSFGFAGSLLMLALAATTASAQVGFRRAARGVGAPGVGAAGPGVAPGVGAAGPGVAGNPYSRRR